MILGVDTNVADSISILRNGYLKATQIYDVNVLTQIYDHSH